MANPDRGEVAVEIGGTSYTLKHSINAAIEVEALFSKAEGRKVRWQDIVDEVNAGSMAAKRAIFWAMLRTFHPQITIEQAGDLSDQMDADAEAKAKADSTATAAKTSKSVLAEALLEGQPDVADLEELAAGVNGRRRPRTAQATTRTRGGTGAASSSGRARSG